MLLSEAIEQLGFLYVQEGDVEVVLIDEVPISIIEAIEDLDPDATPGTAGPKHVVIR